MALVIASYPQQAMWPTVGVMQSNRPDRKTACQSVLARAQVSSLSLSDCLFQSVGTGIAFIIKQAERLSLVLLKLANDKKDQQKKEEHKRDLTISQHFDYVKSAVPSKMIIPLQDALTATLPSTADTVKTHNPFPSSAVEIKGEH